MSAETAPDAGRERGSITLWAVITALVLMICVGLAYDLGGKSLASQRADDVAAQAARAAGQQLIAPTAVRGQGAQVDTAAAAAAARTYLASAAVGGSVSVAAGNVVVVDTTDTYTPVFLSMIGIGAMPVHGHQTSRSVRAMDGTER